VFFSGAFQGAYTLKISSTIPPDTTVSFTVNRIIDRPKLKQGDGTAVDADTTTGAITVTTGGGNIVFSNEDFAKAIVMSGRSISSIAIESGSGTVPAIGTVLEATNEVYAIKASALTSSVTYKLTIVTSNFVKATGGGSFDTLNSVVYYIKVNS
jgi:hypothetical protein